jgi:hypothetical protein
MTTPRDTYFLNIGIRVERPLRERTGLCFERLHLRSSFDFFSTIFRMSSGLTPRSTIRRRAIPYAGSASARRLSSSTGGRESNSLSSATLTLKTCAILNSTSSDGKRRPSSISDTWAADKPSSRLANSLSDRSRSSRSSRILCPSVFLMFQL